MSLSNLSSDNVTMFPSSTRSGYDAYSRFTTEYNLTQMIDQVTDVDGFISDFSASGNISFNIKGYMFVCPVAAIISATGATTTSNTTIYAAAYIGYGEGGQTGQTRLWGWDQSRQTNTDSDGNFIGLSFTTNLQDVPSDSGNLKWYTLPLITFDGSSVPIPVQSSLVKVSTEGLGISTISNAEINSMWNQS